MTDALACPTTLPHAAHHVRTPDVRALTTAIASGDPEAFAVLYGAWFDRMVAEARRVTGRDESFCLDVVQDAMMRVVRSLRPVDDERMLAAWLRRTVRSCAYDRLRADLRRRRREQRWAAGEAAPAATTVDAQRLAWLRDALDDLDDTTREAVELRHRAGLTLRAIAARLGSTTGGVDGRIRRGLARLRRRDDLPGDDT